MPLTRNLLLWIGSSLFLKDKEFSLHKNCIIPKHSDTQRYLDSVLPLFKLARRFWSTCANNKIFIPLYSGKQTPKQHLALSMRRQICFKDTVSYMPQFNFINCYTITTLLLFNFICYCTISFIYTMLYFVTILKLLTFNFCFKNGYCLNFVRTIENVTQGSVPTTQMLVMVTMNHGEKLDKFNGLNFKRWNQKMFVLPYHFKCCDIIDWLCS